jgi:hypothetical protein
MFLPSPARNLSLSLFVPKEDIAQGKGSATFESKIKDTFQITPYFITLCQNQQAV